MVGMMHTQAMESVPHDHTRLNRQFLEERMRDQMEEVVLTQRRRWGTRKMNNQHK